MDILLLALHILPYKLRRGRMWTAKNDPPEASRKIHTLSSPSTHPASQPLHTVHSAIDFEDYTPASRSRSSRNYGKNALMQQLKRALLTSLGPILRP
jgi:hypothetical protein